MRHASSHRGAPTWFCCLAIVALPCPTLRRRRRLHVRQHQHVRHVVDGDQHAWNGRAVETVNQDVLIYTLGRRKKDKNNIGENQLNLHRYVSAGRDCCQPWQEGGGACVWKGGEDGGGGKEGDLVEKIPIQMNIRRRRAKKQKTFVCFYPHQKIPTKVNKLIILNGIFLTWK